METGILPPELKSIEQLFTGDVRYAVPKYQRSFAWGSDEIEELWEDISAAMHRGGDYFLGTIVLHKRTKEPQEIIDGQQRLTCISMMFSAIRNVFLAAGDTERAEQLFLAFLGAKDYSRNAPQRPKLNLNHINNEVFVQHVVKSTNLDRTEQALKNRKMHESNKLLLQAYKFFLSAIAREAANRGTDSDDFIVPLIDTLRNSVKLIAIPVSSEEDANLFFESLNARGKELAISDLVKNRLYLEAGDQVTRAQQLWEQMENELARKPIPEFLRHFWIAKKVDTRGVLVREKHLYKLITKDVRNRRAVALSLMTDLVSSARDYTKISDYALWPDDEAYDLSFESTLRDLRLFGVTQCNPILLNAMQFFSDARDIARTFQIVANFSYRYFIIGNQSPGNLERISNGIAFDIRSGVYSAPRDVADAFRAINPDVSFRSDFALASMPKTRAKFARYTLIKLSNFMDRQSSQQGREQIANPDSKDVNLEHVLPQSVPQEWASSFAAGVDPGEYVYRLGNLTLLATKVNLMAANASFAEKKRVALDQSNLPINHSFRTTFQWNEKEIERRQNQMARVALEVWKL